MASWQMGASLGRQAAATTPSITRRRFTGRLILRPENIRRRSRGRRWGQISRRHITIMAIVVLAARSNGHSDRILIMGAMPLARVGLVLARRLSVFNLDLCTMPCSIFRALHTQLNRARWWHGANERRGASMSSGAATWIVYRRAPARSKPWQLCAW